MYQITVNDITVDVENKEIKNMHLGVYPPNGRVRVSTPMNIDDEAVRLFIISKISWIRKQQRLFKEQARQTEREFVSGESHYVWGERYLLNVIYQKGNPQIVLRNKAYLDLYVREDSGQAQRQRVMTEWYRKQLKEAIPGLIDKWEVVIGVKVNDWGVKLIKTKWGTCNIEAGRIWLNLELAKKPERCLEYIIVHEMMHLLERDHNERFVALMDQFMPKWRIHRDELNALPLRQEKWGY